MINQGDKLYSILHFKCPKCHEGDLYPTSLTSLRKTFKMNDQCDHCGQAFELEPGFYWGSMYVAYALSSGFLLFGFALIFFLFGTSIITTFFIVFGVLILLYGLVFRLARSIWINIYVNYDPKAHKQPEIYKSENN
jgi:uncharacterized protein (DUF983 family)